MSLGEFKTAQRLVQEQLYDDIRENERIDWFEPKMATFEKFMSEYEMWKMFKRIHKHLSSQIIVFRVCPKGHIKYIIIGIINEDKSNC